MSTFGTADGHPMTIKVMRLCAPSVRVPSIPSSSTDCAVVTAAEPHGGGTFHHPSLLQLPDGFGSIYAGQRFSSYICVLNHSDLQLADVHLTAELQSEGARKLPLDDRRKATGTAPPSSSRAFAPGNCLDIVVESFLAHVGSHILRVCVEYRDPMTGMPKEFRKFYRFTVQDPISFNYKHVSVKAPESSPADDSVLVEVQLGNSTPYPVNLATMAFQSADGFEVEPLFESGDDSGAAEGGSASTVDPLDLMDSVARRPVIASGDIAQFVYRVVPKPPATWKPGTTVELGRLSVLWRMHMGEQGLWTSQPMMMRTPASPHVVIRFVDVPPRLTQGASVDVQCVVENQSPHAPVAIAIRYQQPAGAGVALQGLSSQVVGTLEPSSSKTVPLRVLGLSPGWHELSGLYFIDAETDEALTGGVSVHAPALLVDTLQG